MKKNTIKSGMQLIDLLASHTSATYQHLKWYRKSKGSIMKENLEKIAPLSPVKGMAGLSKYLEYQKQIIFCG